jgi:type I restriction enzyme S subunit
MVVKSKYKITGIDWMPEVPEHWQIVRLKNVTKVVSGATPKSGVSTYWDGNINWITPAEFGDEMYIGESERKITKSGLESCAAALVPIGSIIISNRAPIGSLGITKVELCTNQGCKSIIPENINNYFLYFILSLQKENLNVLGNGTTFRELATPTLKNYKIPLPPREEQDQIANFLYAEAVKILRFIQSKQRFIELLKEQRQSIITNAVTKGIDENVKMKETVLGEIPEHWEVRRLKFLAEVNFSTVDKHSHKEEKQVRLCNYVDVYKHEYITNDFDFMLATATDAEIKRFVVEKGDVIITKDSESASDIAIPALVIEDLENVICAYHLAQVKPYKWLVESEFLFRLFQSKKINSHFEVSAKGVTRYGLSYDDINSVLLPYPPSLAEQQKVTHYIRTETRALDITIKKAEREIELIKEFRESMIAEAITGKLKI